MKNKGLYRVILKESPFNFDKEIMSNAFTIDFFNEKELVEFITENDLKANMKMIVIHNFKELRIPEINKIIDEWSV